MRCELRARRATAAVIGCPVANIGEAAKQIGRTYVCWHGEPHLRILVLAPAKLFTRVADSLCLAGFLPSERRLSMRARSWTYDDTVVDIRESGETEGTTYHAAIIAWCGTEAANRVRRPVKLRDPEGQ